MNTAILLWMLGPSEIFIILIIVVLLFGAKKIPELMKGVGKGIKEFKKATTQDAEGASAEDGEKAIEEKE